MVNIIRKTTNGYENISGRIYKGVGIYKHENNGRYYAILMNGQCKCEALCDCSKLKLIKEFIDNVLNLVSIKDMESTPFDCKLRSDIAKIRNEYWLL